jgi:hypothetical protein
MPREAPMTLDRILPVGTVWLLGVAMAHAQAPFPNNPLGRAAERLGAPAQRQTWDEDAPAGFATLEHDERTRRLFDYLSAEYPRLLEKTRHRTGRGLILVCASRIPTDQVTQLLLESIRRESDPVVRMVAWQAVLSRARFLTPEQHRQWVESTWPLVRASAFNGMLRAPLVDLLRTIPADRNSRETFARIFATTNSSVYEDGEVLDALCRCAAAWKNAEVIEFLINRMAILDDAFRAQRVLAAAGAPDVLESRRDLGSEQMVRLGVEDVMAWWKTARPEWLEPAQVQGQPWRGLRPQFLPGPATGRINPDDADWRRDLELRPPHLRSFDVGMVVDATGSMGPVLKWLHRDVKRMMKVFGLVSLEPRIGLTFYRDVGDEFVTRSQPLTGNVNVLIDELARMDARGGGDLPEAVYDGLNECLTRNAWVLGAAGRRAVILIGDAPPRPGTLEKSVELVRRAAESGLKLYAIKARTGYGAADLPEFDALAAAGNGQSMWIDEWIGAQDAGRKVVEAVLVDAIDPGFKDRIAPFVAVIWEMVSEPIPEAHKPFGPRRPPPPPEHGDNPERRPPPRPHVPFDPQKQ